MSGTAFSIALRSIRRAAGVPMSVRAPIIHADNGKRILTGTILTRGWGYAGVSSWKKFTIPANRRTRSVQC